MKTIDNFNFNGQKVLVRVDFNVPLDKKTFAVTDDTRIRAAIPTIKKILADGGSVILMSHLGRPLKKLKDDGTVDYEKHSLKHVVKTLSEKLGTEVIFAADCIGEPATKAASALKPGEVLLLENLRFHKEEEKGNESFAQELASLGTCYVNDAFGTAHRAHASTAVIAKFFPGKKYSGYLLRDEVMNAERVLKSAEKPFTAILGGAKVSDKILLIESLLSRADNIIIGGGMAYTFFKALGGSIGNSLVEDDRLDLAKSLIEKAKQQNVNLLLPVDSVVADRFEANATIAESASNNIPEGWMGLDISKKAIADFSEAILKSKTILWNGPMGVFEMEKFQNGTKSVADAVAEATSRGAFSLVGGGDSVAAVNKFGLADKVSYVSTGGGAMLEYFEGKVLPGVQALEE
jgi:phosphoglycerate kinase